MLTRIVPLACCALAVVLSGCVWGHVTDAVTGEPIRGATVTFRDAVGNFGTATTGEDGFYRFDGSAGPTPTAGQVRFQVSAAGYATLTVERDVQYDDNQEHTWGVENFTLVRGGG